MREIIPHEDFRYFSNISEADFSKVQKARKMPYDVFHIIISGAALILLVFLNRTYNIDFFTNTLIILVCAMNIFVRSFHLFCTGHICGLAYGVVTDKQTKSKLIHTYAKYDIYPWELDDYNHGREKPFRAYVKEYYYVNASICDTNQCLQHICCYEKDYNRIRIGDKVIIAKFKDGNIVVIPAV